MKEDVFESPFASDREHIRAQYQERAAKDGTGYGKLDRSVQALKANLKSPLFDVESMWDMLQDCYDEHQHGGPSSTVSRLFDETDFAIHGCYVGMGGIVFKNHDSPSTRSVILAQKAVDQWAREHGKKRIELYGGVVLNYAVGGLNPDAIVSAYRLGGRYVWLPNMDANHHRRFVGEGEGQGIDLLDEEDHLVPKMKEILDLMSETDMVLGTSHTSTRERLMVVREARKMGIERITVTHVNHPVSWLTPEQCKMFADLGAYIGIYAMDIGVTYTWDDVMAVYRAVGPERIVLGSDCGHYASVHPVEGMRRLMLGFAKRGVTDKDIRVMSRDNTYNLLH
ncbi:DUF6282 family protein [Chloroflexota bacterium]